MQRDMEETFRVEMHAVLESQRWGCLKALCCCLPGRKEHLPAVSSSGGGAAAAGVGTGVAPAAARLAYELPLTTVDL